MELFLVITVGLIGGAAVGLQSPIAGSMGQKVGSFASSLIIHISGAFFSALFLLIRGGEKIRDWNTLPWYMLCAGIFGVILYQTINITLPRLGSTMMVALIIIGQLGVGVIIDHFGLLGVVTRPIDTSRILGVIVLAVGAYLIAR